MTLSKRPPIWAVMVRGTGITSAITAPASAAAAQIANSVR
jgi:hypothetical protein